MEWDSGTLQYMSSPLVATHSRGAVAGSNTPEATDRCVVLKEEVKDLEDYEKLIDQHKNVRILNIF